MLAFPATVRIFLAVEPVDMRKQFNGLWAEAQGRLQEDPFDGALFVFTNKRRNLVKLLYWDGSGVWVEWHSVKQGCRGFSSEDFRTGSAQSIGAWASVTSGSI